ncbi:MAG: hypothetical protein ACJ8FT_05015 [Sphingomonas sp.]
MQRALSSPLVGDEITQVGRRDRLILFAIWLVLAGWLWSTHVMWRDEVRAFSFALSGSNYAEMLRNVHGEGHPALWYLILRGAHDLFPVREVLPIAGLVFGVAAMAVFAFLSPFRLLIIALVLFSGYGAFEFVAISRNYGIAALVMFVLAALYGRVRNSLWFGLILALLANTNVPSCIFAGAFLMFRFVEMLTGASTPTKRDWLIFAGNAVIAALGALLCFVTVYPTINDAAVSSNANHLNVATIAAALVDSDKGFSHLIFPPAVLALTCLAFVRRPAALAAAVSVLVALKLFFFFIYPSFYRHEMLYVAFLLSLFWMTAKGAGGTWREMKWMNPVQIIGSWSFVALLAAQAVALGIPVREQLSGLPYSHSADVAKLLQRPELSGAIVMADPDTMLEPLPYYVNNPLWLLRRQRFGNIMLLTRDARQKLTLDDVLADAERLHRQTGRPIVFLCHLPIPHDNKDHFYAMFGYETDLKRDSVKRFLASTRHIATLRGLHMGDEIYDVFVYPR